GDCRFEAVEDKRADVEASGVEHRHDLLADFPRLAIGEALAADFDETVDDQLGVVATQAIAPLPADRHDPDGLAGGLQLADLAARLAQDGRIEAASEAAIGG